MKKITLLLLTFFMSFVGYSQLTENFDEGTSLPTGWVAFNNGQGTAPRLWRILPTAALSFSTPNSAFSERYQIGQGNTSQDWLATSAVTLPANAQLQFVTRQRTDGDQGAIYRLMVARVSAGAQNNPAIYQQAAEWDELSLNPEGPFNGDGTPRWDEHTVDLRALGYNQDEQVYLAFVKIYTQPGASANDADVGWHIDDVRVSQKCEMPTQLAAPVINMTSAQLSWVTPTGGATSWEIVIVPETLTLEQGIAAGNLYTYSGAMPFDTANYTPAITLNPDTNYKYYVRAVCSATNKSDWTLPYFFTTASLGETCAEPILIPQIPYQVTDNTSNSNDRTDVAQGTSCGATPAGTNYMAGNEVFYSFTAPETGEVRIRMTPTAANSSLFVYNGCENVGVSCIAGVANTGSTVRTIPALAVTAGQTYIVVISSAAANQIVGYTLNIQYVTCDEPTDLEATATMTSASLSWSNPAGSTATSWEIAVQPAGAMIPSGAGTPVTSNTGLVVTNTLDGTPLVAATAYQYWVRVPCTDGGTTFSPWAGPFLFNTPVCDPSEQCNYTFRMTRTSGAGYGGAIMHVRQNGVTVAILGPGFTSGTASAVQVPLCNGIPFELFWVEGGTASANIGITVQNSFNQLLFTKAVGSGSPNTASPLYSKMVDCLVPLCPAPINLGANAIAANSANLTWTPGSLPPPTGATTQWQIYIEREAVAVAPSNEAPTSAYDITTTRPYPATGLLSDTFYVYYIRTYCGPDWASDWVGPFRFKTAVSCGAPTNLGASGQTTTTANLFWTQPTLGGATNWDVVVQAPGTGVPELNPTNSQDLANGGTVSGLTAATQYEFYVRANCSDTDNSSWSGPFLFYTACNPVNVPYTEGFNTTSVYEPCWSVVSLVGSNTWDLNYNVTPSEGDQVASIAPNNGVQNDDWLISPALRLLTNYRLRFKYKVLASGNNNNNIEIKLSTAGSDPTSFTETLMPVTTWSNTDYQEKVINLNNFGTADGSVLVHIGWHLPQGVNNSTRIFIDEVILEPIPPCPNPTDLIVENVTSTSADLSWNPGYLETQWQVYVQPAGGPVPPAAYTGALTTTNTDLTVSTDFNGQPLQPGTNYVYYVRAFCNDTQQSQWVGPIAFKTLLCEQADKCNYTFILQDTGNNAWGSTMNVIQNGEIVAVLSKTGNGASINQVVALCPGVQFQVFWNLAGTAAQAGQVGLTIQNSFGETIFTKTAGQGVQNTTLYNSMPVYCTPLSCPFPTNLSAQQSSATSATLVWTAGGSETQWQYIIQPAGGTYPGNVNGTVVNTNPTANVFGLVSAQPYEFYVRAICGPDNVSYWSGPYTFTLYNSPGCIGVDIEGVDVNVGAEVTVCPNDNCVDLSASYFQINQTDTYTVERIDYMPPFPFTGGTPIPIGTDDDWTDTVTLPFNFCFFGETYNKLLVTDNGAVSFSIAGVVPGGRYTPLGAAGWDYDETIPFNPPTVRPPYVNAIMGVMQDLYPGGSTGDWSINYQVLGTAPCRAFVVNFYNVSRYSCTSIRENSQIVLYEGSNIIDIYIGNHSTCSWGPATVGIQNANGTIGFAPPGRNTGNWSTTNEAWRFNPAGDPLDVAFEWRKDGVFYSNDLDINVCVDDVTLMEAVATYEQCGADPIVRKSEITINIEEFDTQEPEDLTACAGNATFDLTENNANILDGTVTPADYVIEYYLTEAEAIDGTSGAITSHTTSVTTPIFVRIEKVGTDCFITDTFNLLLSAQAPEFTLDGNTTICEGDATTITVTPTNDFDVATTTFTWTLPDGTVSTQNGAVFNIDDTNAQEGTYTVLANNGCEATQTFTLTINEIELEFTYQTPICPSGIIEPTPSEGFTTGGSYSVLPALTIDATTGAINLDGAAAGLYTVTYLLPNTVSGCTDDKTNTFEFEVLPAVVPGTGFTYPNPQYCITDASPINIIPGGDFQTGGQFTAVPETGLGLDPNTGSIDFASTTAGTYTVYYTIQSDATNCTAYSQSSTQIVINASGVPVTGFSYASPVCISSTNPTPIPVAGFVTGGSYTVISGSGIALDGTTGEIDLANTAAGTYTIRYEIPASGCGQLGRTDAEIVINALTPAVVGFTYNTVCENAASSIPVKAAGFTESGTWSSADAGVIVDAATGAIDLAQSTPGTYTIEYNLNQNDTNCTAGGNFSSTVTITAGTNPVTQFSFEDDTYCSGANSIFPQGTFEPGGSFSAPAGLVINGTTGEINIAGSTPGTYQIVYVIEEDAALCRNRSESNFTITIQDGVEVTIEDLCENNNYILTASPQGGNFSYIWRNAQGDQVGTDFRFNVSDYVASLSGQPVYPMNFTVTVNDNGCLSTETFAVNGTFCTIQKGISPNNDGKNDSFDLTGFNVRKLTIYNRYGTEVYSFSNYTNEWKGQSNNGNELPDGTYYYIIERDGVEGRTGWIQINRQRN